jgi:hypothetical protein
VNPEELWSRLAIQDLTNRYALYVDTKQLDRLIDLFWPDAVFDESALGVGPFQGQAAIREYFQLALPSVFRGKRRRRECAAPEGLLSRYLSAEFRTMEIPI